MLFESILMGYDQDAVALADGEFFLPGVLGLRVAPVTALVTGQKLSGIPMRVREQREGPRRCYQLSEGE